MDWLGIGVLIIGIAILILAIVLIKPLNKASELIDSAMKTTDRLPQTLDNVTAKAEDVLDQANVTLADVNGKVAQLTPLFQIVGDAGRISRDVSASAVEATYAMRHNTEEAREAANRQGLNGLYGAAALGYYLYKRRKTLKQVAQEIK